jgi:thymidylate synthase (FAD)
MNSSVADSGGCVECLEVFGNDLTVVNAARVSFAKESNVMTLQDEKLIRYLARNNHISPFFHPQIRFRIKMPIFVAREWFRHTIGLARNEVSRRYVDTPPECWIPVADDLRERDPNLKQGSKSTAHPLASEILAEWSAVQKRAMDFYDKMLKTGVAPEIARSILPQGMYTEFIETGSLAAYARICQLRLDPHAQKEIRDYAEAISNCLRVSFPVSWAALSAGHTAPVPALPPQGAPAPAPVPAAPPAPAYPDMSHLNHWGC